MSFSVSFFALIFDRLFHGKWTQNGTLTSSRGPPFWRPFSGIDFGSTFGSHLASFWLHFGPFGFPFSTFGLPFAPFWLLLGSLFAPFGSFLAPIVLLWLPFGDSLAPAARFQDFCCVFFLFPVILHEFLLIFFLKLHSPCT